VERAAVLAGALHLHDQRLLRQALLHRRQLPGAHVQPQHRRLDGNYAQHGARNQQQRKNYHRFHAALT
jgi:hypothetical protein